MKEKIDLAPVAITSDGMFVGNLATVGNAEDAHALLDRALEQGRTVFIGVLLNEKEVLLLRKKLDDSAADGLACLWAPGAVSNADETPGRQRSAEPGQRRPRTARKS